MPINEDSEENLSHNFNKKFGSSGSKASNTTSKNIFGYSLIPNDLLSNALDNILRWLNHFVLSTPLRSFPDDVITSNGAQIFDLYCYLSGKIFQNKAKLDIPMKRVERVNLIIKQYEDFLKVLMVEGGLLGTIRPYYLLSYTDFNHYLKTHPVNYINPSSFKPTMAQFSYISADSWITLFYQIIKIFYLSRITVKSFKKQFPNQKLPEYYLEESNIYSINEAIILRWIELYQQDPAFRLTTFDRELKNSLCLASIIQGYINTSTIKGILNLKPDCLIPEDYLYNGEKVLQALSFIGLENHTQAKNLANPSARENLLFLIHIYQSLLNYIPKHQPIVFSCILGQEVIKNIELKNPTKKVISFWVKIEGNKDFIIESDTLRIEPSGKADFQVRFQSRIFEPVAARLTFFNKRESNINAAAIVFDLKSDIIERKSQEIINIQSPLYQTKQEIITVKNIFTNSSLEFSDFHVTLLIDKIPKETPKKQDKKKTSKKAKKPIDDIKKAASMILKTSFSYSSKEINSPKMGTSKIDMGSSKIGSPKIGSPKNGSPKMGSSNSESSPKGNKNQTRFSNENREQILNFLMPTFIVSKDKVHLRRGESVQISLIFLPVVYENYKCRVIFCDKEVGEFQIEVLAETLLPEISGDIRPGQNNPIYVDILSRYEHNLVFRNESLNVAKKFHEGRLANTAKYKENILKFKSITKTPEEILFNLELTPPSPYITIPNTFLMKDPYKGTILQSALLSNSGKKSIIEEEGLDQIKGNIENKLPIDFQFKFPVAGETHNLIMRSEDNSDIRIYKLILTVNPKMIKGTLKLKCAFGDELKQEIPFMNTSERDWLIRTTITWDITKYPGMVFSGLRELTIKRKSQGNFILHFHPQNPLENYEGKLSITNSITNDHYEYDLIGVTQDPLARGHLVIKCIAQSPEKRTIEVMNPYKDHPVIYLVETDLINAVGPNRFTIEPNKSYKYILTINPLIGGVYTGSITFYEENDKEKYIWYTVSLEIERSCSKGELAIKSEIRRTVDCEISLFNPLDETLTFEAIIEGIGLIGDPLITINPKKTATYLLSFLPLHIFNLKGSISFINEKIGEIWYDLALVSSEQKTEKLPIIKAELGKSKEIKINLENPSFEPASVQSLSSNPGNFSVYPDNIIIPPLKEFEVTIKYTPSNLDLQESGELTFNSDTIGKWSFIVIGIGTPPDKFPSISISCPVDKDLTQIVTFRNPLKEEIAVQILLKQEGGGFRLMTNKLKVSISGLSNFQIPYIFVPKGIKEYECDIIVIMNEKVRWVFPIKGFGEYVMKDVSFNYKAKSREILNSDLKMIVPGVIETFLKKPFMLSVDNVPEEFINAINRCLKIVPIKNTLGSLDDHLKFKIVFSPMKPFKVTLDMLLTTGAGGRWK